MINIGRNTSIEVKLSPAVEDVITVTAESPLLDERRISTGATVSQTELEKIPTARDPWAILQTTPGVLTDRINVGGNESGQQSQYVGPGSGGDQAVWSVDGVVITDMAALGSSPAYYDFDSFEEMQVTTGGSDTHHRHRRRRAQHGDEARHQRVARLRPVTTSTTDKQVGPQLRRAADARQTSSSLRSTGPSRRFKQGNRIVSVKDYGAELGGPIVKDRLWVWGSYGQPEGRPADHRRRQRLHRPEDRERQAERADPAEQLGDRLLLQQRQGQDRPQRRPDPPPGDHLEPGPLRQDADRVQGSRTPTSSARTST